MPALTALLAALGPWIARFFFMKGALLFTSFLGRIGLVLATNEFVMEPLIDHVTRAWNAIPSDWQCWFGLLGVTKMASIMVTGMSLLGAKRVFFSKS
ncbi:hypothetical protein [Luteimonas sp. TWI1437]|uniref:hypothetical protein n=1 Tax=unclassified Luteimonas TaxID=2629088 RepID=UPI003208BEDB